MEGLDQVNKEFSFEDEKKNREKIYYTFSVGNDVNWSRAINNLVNFVATCYL